MQNAMLDLIAWTHVILRRVQAMRNMHDDNSTEYTNRDIGDTQHHNDTK